MSDFEDWMKLLQRVYQAAEALEPEKRAEVQRAFDVRNLGDIRAAGGAGAPCCPRTA